MYGQPCHKGKEFYCVELPTFGEGPLLFIISSDTPTKGYVKTRDANGTEEIKPFTITNPSKSITIAVDDYKVLLVGAHIGDVTLFKDNLVPSKKYVYIRSDDDVEVSMLESAVVLADRSLLYPKEFYGTEYIVTAPPSRYYKFRHPSTNKLVDAYSYSQCAIVATEDNTMVTVESPVNLVGDFERTVTTVLKQGESYLVQARPSAGDTAPDLTGTRITSSSPVAVMAGCESFYLGVPRDSVFTTNDVFDQILPVKFCGLQFVITNPTDPLQGKNNGPNYYKVTALNDTSTIVANEETVAKLKKRESVTLPLSSFAVVKASSPVSVIILRQSGAIEGGEKAYIGDPFMVDLPAVEYWRNQYRVSIGRIKNINMFFSENYVNIVIPTEALSQLKVNGKFIDKNRFKNVPPFPVSGMCKPLSYGTIPLPEDDFIIEAPVPFGIYCYGYQIVNAYGYVPGRNLNPIESPVLRSSYKDTVVCPGSSVQLSAKGGDGSYLWSPKEGLSCSDCPNPMATPVKNTTYTVISKMLSVVLS